jgi:hypothetical protein
MYVAVFSVIANAGFDYPLSRVWGSLGIALATSALYACDLPIQLFALRHMIGSLEILTPPPALLHLLRSVRSRYDAVPWCKGKEGNRRAAAPPTPRRGTGE